MAGNRTRRAEARMTHFGPLVVRPCQGGSLRERVGREAAVEQLGQQPAKVVVVAERVQPGFAAGLCRIIPPGGDGLFQGLDCFDGQGLLLLSSCEGDGQSQSAGDCGDRSGFRATMPHTSAPPESPRPACPMPRRAGPAARRPRAWSSRAARPGSSRLARSAPSGPPGGAPRLRERRSAWPGPPLAGCARGPSSSRPTGA
jgi:hypothetical protein